MYSVLFQFIKRQKHHYADMKTLCTLLGRANEAAKIFPFDFDGLLGMADTIMGDLAMASAEDTVSAATLRSAYIKAMNKLVSLDEATADKEAATKLILAGREMESIEARMINLQDREQRLYEELDLVGASLIFLDLRLRELKAESQELVNTSGVAELTTKAVHAERQRCEEELVTAERNAQAVREQYEASIGARAKFLGWFIPKRMF